MSVKREALDAIQSPADQEALRRQGFSALDDLWREIGKDQDRGIDTLSQATGVDRSSLARDLMDDALREAGEKGSSWLRRHILDLLLAAAALVLVILVARAVPRAGSVGIALRDLRADEKVGADALHGADPDQITDRRLTRDVSEGAYVDPAWLVPVPSLEKQKLNGRYRMTLRIGPENLRLLPSLPALASLAVSTTEGDTPRALLLRDVPVLSTERSGDAVNLDAAFTEKELRDLLPLLPKAEIRVLRRVP